ncbi:hypothetical protein IV494_08625 [Kaistella sp. G5-32]|uniref:DUF5675 domain-containing protein n=1 Tax=Kaistella gelatinilytica TaxID=2787636 RepID=A0ABS0FC51_9FLAO|nr:DUF5675 family protein [Kaistella gelatinilytica]MBF8457246.1 hypothetical protein [Kaistella gelatinilytica]
MEIQLIRTYRSKGVNGILCKDGKEWGKTIELPWVENAQRISCIPEGTYILRKRYSPKFKWHFEVLGVKGRSNILIHPANDALKELQGCIAPVLQHTGEGKGNSSRIALQRMKDHLYPILDKGKTLQLTIKNKRS